MRDRLNQRIRAWVGADFDGLSARQTLQWRAIIVEERFNVSLVPLERGQRVLIGEHQDMNIPELVDEMYEAFVDGLGEPLAEHARDLPRALRLAPRPNCPWSEVFSHEVTLGAPALFAEGMNLPPDLGTRRASSPTRSRSSTPSAPIASRTTRCLPRPSCSR